MKNYKLVNRLFAAIAFLISFILYLKTIAPTVSFWDCGEFITCSYILGIPHPPGAPFYLLIGRLFSMIPFTEDIALRVNMISAVTSALTVMLTYLIIVRLIKQWRGQPKHSEDMFILVAGGLMGALAFAFTDTFWFNAVEAEVYAISMFFTAFIVYLILVWLEKADQIGSERYLLLIAYLVGLAIGVHLLMILVLPAIFLIIYYKYLDSHNENITLRNLVIFAGATILIFFAIYPGVVQWIPNLAGHYSMWAVVAVILGLTLLTMYTLLNRQKVASIFLMSFMLVIVGYSTYSLIYIRSNLNPAIDENDPETIKNMVSYLNREQYGKWSTFPRRFPGLPNEMQFNQQYPNRSYSTYKFSQQMDFMWNYQISKMYLRYFAWQYIGKGTTLGSDGYIKEHLSTKGLFALPFLIGMIGMVHHFYRHKRHAFSILGIFILTGVAIVIYLNQEDPQPRERDYVYVGSFWAFAIWIGIGMTAILEWIKDYFKNKNIRTLLYVTAVCAVALMAPVNLLAHNYQTHDRTGNYVAYDYSYNILQSCDPDAILFTNGDNDTFPLWFLQFVYDIRRDVRVVNLSLLNTPWYIKQLKHEEPKVPISLSDGQIEQMEVMPWKKQTVKIPIPSHVRQQAMNDLGETIELLDPDFKVPEELIVEVEPTLFGQGIRVQDLMILNIVYANRWEKPVNFAVTVANDNKINMDKYMRMDGLAFTLTPYVANDIEPEIIHENLFETFQFRGLNDSTVYYNNNIIGLLQNYRAAFLRLVRYYYTEKEFDKMLSVLDRMEEVLPEDVIPIPDFRLSMQIGQMYDLAGRPDVFIQRLQRLARIDPDNAYITATLISVLSREGKHGRAVELLEKWVAQHPDDSRAKERLEQERRYITQQDTTE